MANKTFLVTTSTEFAKVLADAIDQHDSDNGFKVSGHQTVEKKHMTLLAVQLVDGTVFDIMIERRK